jgi:hypothetical protein
MATYATILAAAEATIAAAPVSGFGNGTPYVNNAVPAHGHVTAVAKWPVITGTPKTFTDLETAIVTYAQAAGDTATRTAIGDDDKMDFESAVIVAVARATFARFFGLAPADVSVAESQTVTAVTAHADHHDALKKAIDEWALPAARYMGLAWYNGISVETSAHNHLPAKTKKLWTTTRDLLKLKDFFATNARRENWVAHDAFHPLSDVVKSKLARNKQSKAVLVNLKLGNLAKRIPVKAPDTGVALNYPSLASKAFGYSHTPADLPSSLRPPKALIDAIGAYVEADDATAAADAVSALQRISVALEEPSAYLAGFILGKDSVSTDNSDLTLREARATNTILGSPAYERASSNYPGTFDAGRRAGRARMSRYAQRLADDGRAPRLAGQVSGLGVAGKKAAEGTAVAKDEAEAFREAEDSAKSSSTGGSS